MNNSGTAKYKSDRHHLPDWLVTEEQPTPSIEEEIGTGRTPGVDELDYKGHAYIGSEGHRQLGRTGQVETLLREFIRRQRHRGRNRVPWLVRLGADALRKGAAQGFLDAMPMQEMPTIGTVDLPVVPTGMSSTRHEHQYCFV